MDRTLIIQAAKEIVEYFKNENGNWWGDDVKEDSEIIMLYLAAENYLERYG